MYSSLEIQKKTNKYILDFVNRIPIVFTKGEGTYLFDIENKKYLDFICGIAVTSLGHSQPRLLACIAEQSKKLLHTSNLFYNIPQVELAERLVQKSFPSKVFFFNSGTEANEASFKLCRSYGQNHKNGATTILSLENSFHGRTTASICLTGQKKIHNGFGPLLDIHKYIPINDIKSLDKLTSNSKEKVCAFFVELVQGESGIYPLDKAYVKEAYQLCQEREILFVVDEVQTGIGRTGKLFCFEHYEIFPDVMTLAKALGGGIPLGAILVKEKYTNYLKRGQHGTTLGGNPFATKVGLEILKIIEEENLLVKVMELSSYYFEKLNDLKSKFSIIREIRGLGFHIGLELEKNATVVVDTCREKGLLLNLATSNTIRIMPPLNVKKKELELSLEILEKSLEENKS